MEEQEADGHAGPKKSRAWTLASGWMLVVIVLSVLKPDWSFALTVWPAWILLLPGLLPLLLPRQRKEVCGLTLVICLLVSSEEPWSWARQLIPAPRGEIRVVTLNCAGGSLAAAREVISLKPDLILLQESPSRAEIEGLAKEIFGQEGSLVWGPDASILAKGRLSAIPLARGTSNYVSAEWRLKPGRALKVVSLRLVPPVLRLDLYNPAAWKDFAENRRLRRSELDEILQQESDAPPDVLGGDFNTPPEKGYVPQMIDSFASQGRGYGATCVNPLPCLVRIDQIWTSARLKPVNSFVVKTLESDHRMVVSDFVWDEQESVSSP